MIQDYILKNLICFIGPPGAGKGTYSSRCVDVCKGEFNIHRFSVGDELRNLRLTKSSGELSSIKDIQRVFSMQLSGQYVNLIVDGYPRSIEQMELLLQLREQGKISDITIFNISVPNKSILLERLNRRNNCFQCGYTGNEDACPRCSAKINKREDDLDTRVIDKRIEIYYESYEPIIRMAQNNNLPVHQFDSSGDINTTFELILNKFRQIIR